MTELPLFLVGLPGCGKSKVGSLLARALGVPHVDTDTSVEEVAGRSVSEIFEQSGEGEFRRLETQVVEDLATFQGVVSLGGGAIETGAVRKILAAGNTVWIRASKRELLRRVRRSNRRPLMRRNPERTLDELCARRSPLYHKVARSQVWTSAGSPRKVVEEILKEQQKTVTVRPSGEPPYPVIIGSSLAGQVPGRLAPGRGVFAVYPEPLADLVAPVLAAVEARGGRVTRFPHPDGEEGKTYAVLLAAWDAMGQARIGRKDTVLSIGGGATTDLGGFLAASWLRGIANLNVATTLLGMVDAAVGGKTGINTPAGKNLVGAFHDPTAVFCDLDYLSSLPLEDYRAGLAEVIKCGLIRDTEILTLFQENPGLGDPSWALGEGRDVLEQVVERAIKVKADVVGADRMEAGEREHLNYGHTLAHGLEALSGFKLRHGEAVATGSVFAAELAASLGLLSFEEVERHRRLFEGVGLPVTSDQSLGSLADVMLSDKKVRDGNLRFVLLEGIGKPKVRQVRREQLEEPARGIGLGD